MLPSVLEPSVDDLARLGADKAVELLRDILQAEAGTLGISPTLVTVPSNINAPDGGVDADVVGEFDGNAAHKIIFPGHTYYQVKTGKFSGATELELKTLLFKPKSLRPPPKTDRGKSRTRTARARVTRRKMRPEDFNTRIHECLRNNGTLIIALFGFDGPESQSRSLARRLKELIAEVEPKYKKAKIAVWRAGHIAKLAPIAPAAALVVKGIRGAGAIHSADWMGGKSGFEGDFLAGPEQQRVIETIRAALRSGHEGLGHIRIVGEPGIGKTRLVFEAINTPEFVPRTLYAASAEEMLAGDILTQLEWVAHDASLILIVDECPPEHRTTLHQRLKPHKVALITIYSEIDESDTKSPEYNFISPPALDEGQLASLLATYGVPAERAKWLVPLFGGSPRVAHAVGASLAQTDRIEELLRPQTLDNIWDHYLAGRQGAQSPAYHRRHVVMACVALFKRFGAYYPVAEEARNIFDAVIRPVDANVTWAQFTSTIRELKSRRILQGTATLYITPKLLHIKLWCDWWERYSGAVSPESLMDGLSDKLVEWLADMFVYARESTVASDVVEQLLQPEGYFSRLKAYSEAKGGKLFFALAQANPRAASRVVLNALGRCTTEELRAFGDGRRHVVHALERTALFEEAFENSARALLLLAEAENESWSNNATGVFTGLFTLGYGRIAASALPPSERLPILVDVIRNPNEAIRRLAIDAFGQALRTRFTRISLGDTFGLRELPQGWSPKTYGELFAAYALYLHTFWDELQRLSVAEKSYGIREILNATRELMGMEQVQLVLLDIMASVGAESEDGAMAVLQELAVVLHYDAKGMAPELVQKLQALYDHLANRSYHSRLQRYVRLQLVQDNFDSRGEYREGPSENIAQLVIEAIENPNLLTPELNWLVTPDAQNGYAFGHELAKRDKRQFWRDIFSAWLRAGDKRSDFFIGGYLFGVFEKDQKEWEQAIRQIADSEARSSLPMVVWRSGMSPAVADLILERAKSGEFDPVWLRAFSYGATALKIPETTLAKIIRLLLERHEKNRAEAALQLWFHGMRPRNDAQSKWELSYEILTAHAFFAGRDHARFDTMTDHYWKEAALAFYEAEPAKGLHLAIMCLRHFGEDGTIMGGFGQESQEFLERVTTEHPREIWAEISGLIGPPITTKAFHLLSWLRGEFGFRETEGAGAFRTIPHDVVLAWIDKQPKERAPYIARYVPNRLPRLENPKSLFRELLERYGAQVQVRRELHANFHSEGWAGPTSLHFARKLEAVQKALSSEPHPLVRRWLNEEEDHLRRSIELERAREERE